MITYAPKLPSVAVLLEYSERRKGRFYIGTYYVEHVTTKGKSFVLLDREQAELERSRRIVQDLTGREDAGITYSQLARTVQDWLNIRQTAYPDARRLVPDWHYQECTPTLSDYAELADIKSAYWQIASRVRSPKFSLVSGRVLWQKLSEGEDERWERCKSALSGAKKLRLALIGINAAGWDGGRKQFHGITGIANGKEFPVGNRIGSFQPLSMLCVRVTYELTQMQTAASGAFYANADCCIVHGRAEMAVWGGLGIEWAVKASGPGRTDRVGVWRIGGQQTGNWDRQYLPTMRTATQIETGYFGQVLT